MCLGVVGGQWGEYDQYTIFACIAKEENKRYF